MRCDVCCVHYKGFAIWVVDLRSVESCAVVEASDYIELCWVIICELIGFFGVLDGNGVWVSLVIDSRCEVEFSIRFDGDDFLFYIGAPL